MHMHVVHNLETAYARTSMRLTGVCKTLLWVASASRSRDKTNVLRGVALRGVVCAWRGVVCAWRGIVCAWRGVVRGLELC